MKNKGKKTMNNIKKTIIAASLGLLSLPTFAQSQIDSLYKEFIINDIEYFSSSIFNNLMDIERFKQNRDLRGMADIIDYCYDLTPQERFFCYTTLSKAGHHEALYGIGQTFFEKFEKTDGEKKADYLVFSSILFGMGDGFKKIELLHEAPYRSYRMSYNELKDDENISNKNKSALHSYYIKGVVESMDYPLNTLYYDNNPDTFSSQSLSLNFEGLSETIKEVVDSQEYGEIFMPLREKLDSPTAINFLMKSIANDNNHDIFQALINGENEIPKNKTLGFYGLYNIVTKNKSAEATYSLITELYRDYKMTKPEKITPEDFKISQGEKLEAIIKLSALLKEIDSDYDNKIFDIILDGFNSEENLINTVQKFNHYRKEALFFI